MPKKQQSSNRKTQYGTSYPTHLTRLEEQMKILPYLPYIGMAIKFCTCRLFTRTTWHVDTCCYCRAWNLTWHFHFDHTRSALSTVTSRLHFNCKINGLESGKPGCHRPQSDLFHFEDVALLSGYSAPLKSAYNDVCTDPSNGWNRPSFIIFLIGRREINIFTCLLSSSIPYGRKNLGYKRGFLWHTEWQHLSPGE